MSVCRNLAIFWLVTFNNLRLDSLNALMKFLCIRFFWTPHLKKCCHIYLQQRLIVPLPIVRSLHLGFSRSTCSGSGIVGTTVAERWRSILVADGHGCLLCYYSLFSTNYERSTLALPISNAVIYCWWKGVRPPIRLKLSFWLAKDLISYLLVHLNPKKHHSLFLFLLFESLFRYWLMVDSETRLS